MSALSAFTFPDLTHVLSGRVRQTVHVVRTVHHEPFLPRHTVLVVPNGEKFGELYTCGPHALAALRDGWSPIDLELELDPEEDDDA